MTDLYKNFWERQNNVLKIYVFDRHCFSMEPGDLKNPVSILSAPFKTLPGSTSLCELRGWGTCKHSDAQVK